MLQKRAKAGRKIPPTPGFEPQVTQYSQNYSGIIGSSLITMQA